MKKKMKDRPGLLDDAQRIAEAGRKGDKIIAHINPEEAALLKARGGSGTVNPKTGLLEFWDPSDPGDSGPPSDPNAGQGGGQIADLSPQDQERLGFNPNDLSDTRGVSLSAFNPLYDEAAQAAQFQPRNVFQRAFDWTAAQPREFMQDLRDKPFSTLANIAAPGLFGLANLGVGLATGKSMTDRAIAGIADLTNYGKPETQMVGQLEGTVTGALDTDAPPPSEPGGSDTYRQSDTPMSPQQVASQTTPQEVAQQAFRQATITPPPSNYWVNRAFNVGTQAGKPAGYNWWDQNQFRYPTGILG